jgi:hypothetical protein
VADSRSPGKTSLYVFICLSCGGADRRRKIDGLTVPVAAASQIVISRRQNAHHSNWAWAYRISIKKLSPTAGMKLICGPGPQLKYFYIDRTNILKIAAFKRMIRKFSNIVVAHIKGLRHLPICLFETLFSCRYPFNKAGSRNFKSVFYI